MTMIKLQIQKFLIKQKKYINTHYIVQLILHISFSNLIIQS